MAVGTDGSVIICDAGDARRRIEETRLREIHLLDRELCIKRSLSGIFRIDRPRLPVNLKASIRRQLCGQAEWKGGGKSEVFYLNLNLIVHMRLFARAYLCDR